MAKHFLITITTVATATFIAAACPASAAITTYTSRAAFEAALASPYYLESNMGGAPSYSGNGYSYAVDTNNDPYAIGNDLSTGVAGGAISFIFGPSIKAFGGYFYNTNDDGDVVSAPIRIQVNDGGAFTYTIPADGPSPGSATSFYGFISDSNLINASVTAIASGRPSGCVGAGTCLYSTVGSVIVGTTGGGPAPVPLLGAAAAFGASRRLRRRLIAGRPVAGRHGA
jgi:hypothetical protein